MDIMYGILHKSKNTESLGNISFKPKLIQPIFLAATFLKLTTDQRYYMWVVYTEIHPNVSIILNITEGKLKFDSHRAHFYELEFAQHFS
jgi:hypothetical protein